MTIIINKVGRWGVFEHKPPSKLEAALFNRLAYLREGYQFMENPAWGWQRFYKKQKKCFPIGLLNEVEQILKQWYNYSNEKYQINYSNKLTMPKMFDNHLRDYQIEAAKQLILNAGGILSMPTGSGKTKTAIEFLKRVKCKMALIVVHTLDLKQQWNEQLQKNNLKIPRATVFTYQTLRKYPDELKKFDFVIFDECHHVSAKCIYDIAMRCDNAVVVGLSATPYRNYAPEIMKINAALGNIIYKISIL